MRALAASLLLCLAAWAVSQTVVIDPGHPSEVGRGTRGKKVTELEVAWRVAKDLEAELKQRGYRVVLTKTREEQFVRNRERAETANRAKAALMVRLHCDAASGRGFAVYYPTQAGRTVVAGKTFRGPSRTMLEATAPIAKRFHVAMSRSLRGKLKDNGLRTDLQTAVGRRQGALTGSIFSKVPTVLVEMVVLTNPKDEAFIASERGRRAMVRALADGVDAALRRP